MIDIVQLGMGPLGQKMVKAAVERGCFSFVAAVDPDPSIVGSELGELCGVDPLGIKVRGSLSEAMQGKNAQVALVTTVSSILALESQVKELARAGLHIISTCEELSFPWRIAPEAAQRIDDVCRENAVVCLGTGINPGYLMDFLPTVLTGVCQQVERIEVNRVQDASVRRIPFQQKIGAGLTLEEFDLKKQERSLRHVGLPESVDFIASQMGWTLDRNIETLEPVVAETDVKTGYKPISAGMARGVHQVGRGYVGDNEVITLTFRAAVGEPESYEEVKITGVPSIQSRIAGGVNGDIATCAVTLNTVRSVLAARPGLQTMATIPPVGFFAQLP
jgi:2,4-diaminopentanoate dehydrogenase